MSSIPDMKAPVCLLENSGEAKLRLRPEALEILQTIEQPLVMVAVVGLYRTGKSFLMNKLTKKKTGFSLGSTVKSHTKGIWMWCLPHPCKPDHCLVIIDTEGLGDVKKGDQKNDHWLFALSILMSSMLIYNSMKIIDHNALSDLQYPYSSPAYASNVLFDFKVKKVSEVKILLQMDECLTQKEKEITAEKEKAAIAEQRNRAQEEQVLQIQKQLEDTEKSNKENTEKLLQKMEEERKRMMEENKLLLEEKLQDQERYLKKGFHDIAQAMQKEIKSLKIQVEQTSGRKNVLLYVQARPSEQARPLCVLL
ncbi:guanylate-binding protein 1-like [Latimeria chalumnae]|uniref:guanylate-binding protein 1-like n=1 Tax=Latimeria chalumnae TaxID=7897 RepID=UPI00313BA9D1